MATVEGLRELNRTLKKAGADLGDMKDANAAAARMVAAAAAAIAPKRTGKLAGTARGNRTAAGAAILFGGKGVLYANPIHWGWGRRHIAANPWATRAARNTESQWVPMYLAAVEQALSNVHGA